MGDESGDERFERLLLRRTSFIGRKLIQVRVKRRAEERNKPALERERCASRFFHRLVARGARKVESLHVFWL